MPAASPTPIGDYAVLGDGRTAALISRAGSVDWWCPPRFDAAACFAALLGGPEHGHWSLEAPEATERHRRWHGDSLVLQTTVRTPTGVAVLTDALPARPDGAEIVRRIRVTEGRVRFRHEWVVRFGYGAVQPWVHRITDRHGGAIQAVAGPDRLVLRGSRLPAPVRSGVPAHRDEFTVEAGQEEHWSLVWTPSWQPVPRPADDLAELSTAEDDWGRWARRGHYRGSYREEVVRSLLVLRMLTDRDTGGIVAAATTSLPEDPGGVRNWDYRFCWLRDAAMTLQALLEHGYREEAGAWRQWLLRAVAGDPADLQIVYGVDGRRDLTERALDHLPGYAGSRPVRVGNAAVGQVQNDVLGEVMCALALARDCGLRETADSWSLQSHLVDALAGTWQRPDRGIWEVRGRPRRFTHSAVMAWAALDRAVRAVTDHGLPGPVDRWAQVRDRIRAEVLGWGWDDELGSFVQSAGVRHTDAALLQLAQVGFLAPDDPRMTGTVAAIRAELEVSPGLLLRYRTDRADDGLPGTEHPFLACSGWLADALARQGDVTGADQVLSRLTGLATDLGLLAEEYDPRTGRMIGNIPQALSHLAFVRAVHQHDLATGATR
ncbi:glycoside hydrolase family 15 protein [Cellulomonas denverensis]|uniref:Glycoside hydrolase family 15 protein n=1 Tax=Cellulomonas denverensis TaxID=264297 RepID=A0A7X6KU98_9CELL|nr:glycoside hydrolase family 15 protein [Cellulomonas denverensis]NKY22099.1 glycoside hydrolase family 15 protein [Cellulomonas denverensis]GIG26140.1 glucoamylase [Cellulomonas denverensis]